MPDNDRQKNTMSSFRCGTVRDTRQPACNRWPAPNPSSIIEIVNIIGALLASGDGWDLGSTLVAVDSLIA
jgi:hypothetical protein